MCPSSITYATPRLASLFPCCYRPPPALLRTPRPSVLIVLGLLVDASLIGSMSKLMENLDAGRASKKAHFDEIDQSLRYRRVPKFLHKRIRDYYEYLWECGHRSVCFANQCLQWSIRLQIQMPPSLACRPPPR